MVLRALLPTLIGLLAGMGSEAACTEAKRLRTHHKDGGSYPHIVERSAEQSQHYCPRPASVLCRMNRASTKEEVGSPLLKEQVGPPPPQPSAPSSYHSDCQHPASANRVRNHQRLPRSLSRSGQCAGKRHLNPPTIKRAVSALTPPSTRCVFPVPACPHTKTVSELVAVKTE